MGGDDNDDMRFQLGGENVMNCPSSSANTIPHYEIVGGEREKVGGQGLSSMPPFKSSMGGDSFFNSSWDPLISLSHGENFGGSSSMVSHGEFANSSYNQGLGSSSSHLAHYPSSDPNFVGLGPKISCFGSGGFPEMVGSFGLQDCGQPTITQNYPSTNEGGIEKTSTNDARSQEEGASPNGKRRKRVLDSHSPLNPNMNSDGEQVMELDEKKQKMEKNSGANLHGQQTGKQTKDDCQSEEAPKENYIHMRARRGQATNSHSLAERVRREKISERMRMLQELVPGCNKITGKAVMLDEIINYVQSLQQQVEFLSMKLSTVNPELNIDLERILSKDILHARGGSAAILGIGSGMNIPHPYPHGNFQGSLPGIPSTGPPFHPMPQNVWDMEIQSLLQMGYDSNHAVNDSLGLNGRSKPDV